MALVPEFISVLRDIRDTKYPQISAWYTSISAMNTSIIAMQSNIVNIQADVTAKNTSIKSISVLNPVVTVPNQPNGDAGSASVIYNANTNQFEFALPAGKQGKSMAINYTVATATDLLALTVNTGDIGFTVDTSVIYVKLSTGTNTVLATDWSAPIAITPATTFSALNDTPVGYAGQAGKLVTVDTSETGLVYKTGAEVGIIGYNYVKNPLFENILNILPILANTAFGSSERGYGSFTTFVGTPTLASNNARVSAGVTIANTTAFTTGKSQLGIKVQFDTAIVANSTIANLGNMRLFINASSQFALTDGTLTNSLTVGMIPNVTDIYEILATDQDLIVVNLTTGLMASSSLSLTILPQITGSIILGGDGQVAKYYAVLVQDKSAYTRVDGVYEEFAQEWKKTSTGGELAVIPDTIGANKGFRFIASALQTDSRVRMSVGDGGQFSGKEVTLSFTAYSSGIGANSVGINFVTDRGSQVTTSRLVTQIVGTSILDIGIEKNYSITFPVGTLPIGTFLDADAEDYFEFILPASANYFINVKKPKFEISSIQTEFTPQGGLTGGVTDASLGSILEGLLV